MKYAALSCKSNFSFLEGASHPDELIEESHQLGCHSLALTDRDGVYGIVRAHKKAKELGVHLIIGSQVRLNDNSTIRLLVQNREGYANLCSLLTCGRLRSAKGASSVSWQEVCSHSSGLIALWGGEESLIADTNTPPSDRVAHFLKEAFPNRLYATIARHRRAADVVVERQTTERAQKYGLPLTAANEVLYHCKARRPLQDVLTCIRNGVTLGTAGNLTQQNAEYYLKSPYAMQMLFSDRPSLLAETLAIAEQCRFSLSELRYRYPSERLPNDKLSSEWLSELTFAGAKQRYGETIPTDTVAQLQRELDLVNELDYCGYFLTMYEIVQFCRENDILCQGRGSAANSAVCYCLGITAIDPVQMGLLFERFLSRERAEPPDIDLDIEHERREQVIQHMYKKYGRSHAAMVANFIRYRPRSAVREVGKALGIPETALDRASKMLGRYSTVAPEALLHAGFAMDANTTKQLLQLSNEILDFPRHLSIHPGGFLLGHEPVHHLVPIENATMENRTVIQWDKDDIEELGLFKVDLLGLGALTMLHRCFDLLEEHHNTSLSLATLPQDDPATYDMMCLADTIGVFQIESRAQMSMLPRLRPRRFYDLVIEISIVRPGPISGGMVHPYLRRRNHEEDIDYPHECLRPVLEKTLGVPLFQEQVMKLAMVAADYTPGESDQLRRDMAAWRRSGRIETHRHRLITRMQQKGIDPEFAERVFNQIRGFGEYGFPESHAASFALIAYATSWLRCHYIAEFTCALLNSQPMGFYSPATIIGDAIRHGVEVRPICINQSQWDCTLEKISTKHRTQFALRIGLRYVKKLGERERTCIERARQDGPFHSLADFVNRTRLDKGSHSILAEAGALACFGQSRRQALWQEKALQRMKSDTLPLSHTEQPPQFRALSQLDKILWDYNTTSHSTNGHPLQPLRPILQAKGYPDARTIRTMPNGRRIRYAGLVICRQRPGTAGGVTFMTLEDETGLVNAVIWKKVFDNHAVLARACAFLGITGRLQVQQGIVHLVADTLWAPDIDSQPAKPTSRDFH